MNTLRRQLGLITCLALVTSCASFQTPIATAPRSDDSTATPLAVTSSLPPALPSPVATRVAPAFTSQPRPTAPDTFAVRDALLRNPQNARLVAAGPMLTVPGGYPMVPWGMQGLVIASEKDAVAKVNQLLDDGADVIKIALESGSTFKRQIPVLSKAEAAAIVKIAHARGVRVSAHVTAAEDLERVLDADVDDIAHMPYDHVSDELIARIVKADLYWIPTLELWQHVGVSDVPILDNLRRFVAAGGQVALGTDYAGYAAQFELGMPLSEMEAMQRAGMTPMQIILAGTRSAALVCNLGRELGTLEAGKVANVLVVKGDPLQDIRALASVRLVIHNGAVIRQ